jgi:hypothetical protein
MLHSAASISNLQSINTTKGSPNLRQIWPNSGALLQDTGMTPKHRTKSSLKLYREGSLTVSSPATAGEEKGGANQPSGRWSRRREKRDGSGTINQIG